MEPCKIDPPKLSDMVMCGDHPSITKTELNVKEERPEGTDKEKKDRSPSTFIKASPTASRTERGAAPRALSEHALRLLEARRRARSAELVGRQDDGAPGNRALVQAALGSFRWPPYLVAVWVLVLLLTHLLHCLVTMLERALPPLRKFCQYFRLWTEEAWRGGGAARAGPLALAGGTGALYALYCALYAAHAVALWAIEPLCADDDKRDDDTRVTDYVDVSASVTDAAADS